MSSSSRQGSEVGEAPSVSVATSADVPALFELINEAYEVESGDTGVAFKKTKRLLTHAELAPSVEAGRTLAARLAGELVGCICFEEQAPHDGGAGAGSGAPHLHFGPFAVAARCQGRGVGSALLAALYARARARDQVRRHRGRAVAHRHLTDVRAARLRRLRRRGFPSARAPIQAVALCAHAPRP